MAEDAVPEIISAVFSFDSKWRHWGWTADLAPPDESWQRELMVCSDRHCLHGKAAVVSTAFLFNLGLGCVLRCQVGPMGSITQASASTLALLGYPPSMGFTTDPELSTSWLHTQLFLQTCG